jgi:hypothetical protein
MFIFTKNYKHEKYENLVNGDCWSFNLFQYG